ncbi:iron-sulfur cluster carrier protein ApbC [Roseomonas gilardii]|uniref:Iron-sulfur cluster carrier protein n=1 Tax=Roseomonas gilardii TaxID=257708 RepID=A0A1L7AGG0_9PROT|nr:iron-sulfur cluster carrier protein ApbC [Roseomonas gilardii]APT57863.1 sodium:proton antiporter [Roseomonas gilardii]MDT8331478.1 iron-sulfur cluster carrier protein ApbC [Roseomonas gilardii]PZR16971.1 MAG: iron-sulfur cluster carrier protein ApbC [Azospirillum brasilense]
MESALTDAIRAALAEVRDPQTGLDVVSAGWVQGLVARDGLVQFALEVPRERARALEPVRAAAERAVAAVPGVLSATCVLTAHRAAPPADAPRAVRPPPGQDRMLLPEIGAIVAVASGKGGVGKSTTAVNLAVALAAQGLRVGLLDADIYGPSLPQMLGTKERPRSAGQRIEPLSRWGLKAMSIGFLVDEETAMIWRGPMVMGALEQMLSQVEWGALDVLVVDMPPGTGDAQLTMSQRVPLKGAVIVSTPQDVALIDARRGVRMFEKVNVPVLGLIENMSYFCCPNCNHRTEIFGHGGARAEAEKLGVEFLGELPLRLAIRETADAGTPIVLARPDSEEAATYRAIAARVWEKAGAPASAGPRIIMD